MILLKRGSDRNEADSGQSILRIIFATGWIFLSLAIAVTFSQKGKVFVASIEESQVRRSSITADRKIALHGRRRIQTEGDWIDECNEKVYYEKNINDYSIAELQDLLTSNFNGLRYSARRPNQFDTWDALDDIDSVNGTHVQLIYLDEMRSMDRKQSGNNNVTGFWNREHVWPTSRFGVGGGNRSDLEHNDIHHLFPSDVLTNQIARASRYFDDCNGRDCRNNGRKGTVFPDVMFAGNQTEGKFEPPDRSKGMVARALFYMDLKYSNLELVNNPVQDNQMGNLNTLLEWNQNFKVTEFERQRNNKVCSRWQRNRNPFVDFPELATTIYGPMSSTAPKENTLQPIDDNASSSPPMSPPTEWTRPPSDTNSPTQPPSVNISTGLLPGDVMVIGVNSNGTDEVALLALQDLYGGLVIGITDNAYDGTDFNNNEGRARLFLNDTITAGTVFGYGEGLNYGNAWKVRTNFDLSTRGDTVTVYARLQGSREGKQDLLAAVSFGGDRVDGEMDKLPASVRKFSVELGKLDNYVYTGKRKAPKEALQESLLDAQNWSGSNVPIDLADVLEKLDEIQMIATPVDTTPDTTVVRPPPIPTAVPTASPVSDAIITGPGFFAESPAFPIPDAESTSTPTTQSLTGSNSQFDAMSSSGEGRARFPFPFDRQFSNFPQNILLLSCFFFLL